MARPKRNPDEKWERLKKMWEEAPRDEDGIKLVAFHKFVTVRAHAIGELLSEPVKMTADDKAVCVFMSLDDYEATKWRGFKGRRVRVDGVLYGEI